MCVAQFRAGCTFLGLTRVRIAANLPVKNLKLEPLVTDIRKFET
jgi:hypothetical protein